MPPTPDARWFPQGGPRPSLGLALAVASAGLTLALGTAHARPASGSFTQALPAPIASTVRAPGGPLQALGWLGSPGLNHAGSRAAILRAAGGSAAVTPAVPRAPAGAPHCASAPAPVRLRTPARPSRASRAAIVIPSIVADPGPPLGIPTVTPALGSMSTYATGGAAGPAVAMPPVLLDAADLAAITVITPGVFADARPYHLGGMVLAPGDVVVHRPVVVRRAPGLACGAGGGGAENLLFAANLVAILGAFAVSRAARPRIA